MHCVYSPQMGNVPSTESPGRNGPFDLKEFIAKLQTSPKKSGSPKKEHSKLPESALIQENMDRDLDHCEKQEEKSMSKSVCSLSSFAFRFTITDKELLYVWNRSSICKNSFVTTLGLVT